MFEETQVSFKTSLLTLLFQPYSLNKTQVQLLQNRQDELLKTCAQHRLYNWVLRNLQLIPEELKLTQSTKQLIRDRARSESMQALLVNAELTRLVKLLSEHDMQLIPLKGAHLANFVYPSMDMRPMRDLDFTLSDHKRSIEAFEILINAGYQYPKEFEYDLQQCLLDKKHLPALITPSRLYFVEIHTALYDSELQQPIHQQHFHQLKKEHRLRTAQLGGKELQLMSNEDLFVHIAVHSAKESKFSNGPVCFLDLLTLSRQPDFNWEKLGQIAHQLDQMRSVELVCAALSTIDPAFKTALNLSNLFGKVPDHITTAALRNSLCDTRIKPKQKILLSQGTWMEKTRMLKTQMLPTATKLHHLYPSEKKTLARYLRHWHKVVTEMLPKWGEGRKGLLAEHGQQEISDWQSISKFLD